MTATLIQSPDRVILRNISWHTYQSLIRDFESGPAIRLTYDRGTLEIRMPLDPHETYKKLLGRLIEAATEEFDLANSSWNHDFIVKLTEQIKLTNAGKVKYR
ncbi:MAG: hypothetical protein JOZ78_11365 [Chroococcidiopsidaceae cyanobacterium CP_BM_ER_R8_30]|nr:hypothetical protein [Chroococcidiopsidaceae cyanobacterium CP_BM_ER_R8_30]